MTGSAGPLTGSIGKDDADFPAGTNGACAPIFASRAAAVAAASSAIPADAGCIVTIEAGALVLRARDRHVDDPLFDTPPCWGVVARLDAGSEPNPGQGASDAPVVLTAASPEGQDIPPGRQMALTAAGTAVRIWVPVPDPSGTAGLGRDVNGRWWRCLFDSREPEFRGPHIYVSRADAARLLARDPPPPRIRHVFSIEDGRLVVRSRTRTEDALFDRMPRWGIRAVFFETAPAAPQPGPAGLPPPGRPDYEREHLPDFADPGLGELAVWAGGVPPSPTHFRTHLDYGSNWFEGARVTREAGVACTMPSPYDPPHVVHPQMMEMYAGFRGFRYVCAITAYPNADDGFEDPLLYGSNDRIAWTLLPDMRQPLAVRPNPHSYNSDVFLTQDPRTGELIVGWREVFAPDAASKDKPAASTVNLKIRATRDGIGWSEPSTMYSVAQSEDPLISPGVIYDPARREWRMWSVRRPRLGYYTAPSVFGPWTSHGTFPVAAPRPAPPHHFEIKWLGNRLVALCGDRWTGKQYFALVDPDRPTSFAWSPVSCLEDAAGADRLPVYKASFLPRILPDGSWRMGLWWTGVGGGERILRYAESDGSFAVQGWGRAAEGTALTDLSISGNAYAAALLTPMGRPATLVDRTRIRFRPPAANPGASPGLTVNGHTHVLRRRAGGILEPGDLKQGIEYEIELRSDGSAVCLDCAA